MKITTELLKEKQACTEGVEKFIEHFPSGEAGDGIKAGSDFGIFAGLCIRLNYWSIDAQVIAKTKPKNLISGFWVESSEGS